AQPGRAPADAERRIPRGADRGPHGSRCRVRRLGPKGGAAGGDLYRLSAPSAAPLTTEGSGQIARAIATVSAARGSGAGGSAPECGRGDRRGGLTTRPPPPASPPAVVGGGRPPRPGPPPEDAPPAPLPPPRRSGARPTQQHVAQVEVKAAACAAHGNRKLLGS